MYEKFYGLRAKPFRLSPDPRFFFTSATHKSALAYLRYGLYQSEGFIVVTGGAGTGKTTLVRTLLGELSGREMVVGELVTTQLQADDLLRAIADVFRLEHRGPKSELINRLHGFFLSRAQKGQRLLLVVDEAHNLPLNSFEELRMLSNFQYGARAMLQCILLGQPPLRDLLAQTGMEQLQQRVIAAHHLHPLTPEETRGYILHRLRHAGWCGDPSISGEALGLVHCFSRGIPRRINALCDRLLLFGCLEEKHDLDEAAVTRVYTEWAGEVGRGAHADDEWDAAALRLGTLGREEAGVARPAAQVNPVPPPPVDELTARAPSGAHENIVVPRLVAPSPTPTGTLADTVAATLRSSPRLSGMSARFARHAAVAHDWLRPMAGVGAVLFVAAAVVWLWPQGAESPLLSELSVPTQSTPSPTWSGETVHEDTSGEMSTVPAPVPREAPSAPVPTSASVVNEAPVPVVQQDLNQEMEVRASSPLREAVVPVVAQIVAHESAQGVVPTAPISPLEAATAATPKPAAEAKPVVKSVAKPAMKKVTERPSSARDERPPTQLAAAQRDPVSASTKPALRAVVAENDSVSATSDKVTNINLAAAQSALPAAEERAAPPSPSAPLIGSDELKAVLSRFRVAYEAGDMGSLLRLFSSDARDRASIAEAYEKLFNVTEARHLALDDMRWQPTGEAMRGEGQFGVTVREKGRAREASYTGHISLRVEKRDGKVLITELNHAYAN